MSHEIVYAWTDGPFGPILLACNATGLIAARFEKTKAIRPYMRGWAEDPEPLKPAVDQLHAYFARELQTFDLPLAPQGTAFQKQVWNLLTKIPYGETTSYGALAKQLGEPNASRAVGAANGKNPIAVIIPCHRVIGSNGTLTGYAYGVKVKEALLELEGVNLGAKAVQSELF